jgi:hypothetical protein
VVVGRDAGAGDGEAVLQQRRARTLRISRAEPGDLDVRIALKRRDKSCAPHQPMPQDGHAKFLSICSNDTRARGFQL